MIKQILQILFIILSLHKGNNVDEPVRLDPPVKKTSFTKKLKTELKKLDWKVILFILIVIGIFILISLLIFKTGSLESTQTYNNRLIE